MSDLKSKLPDMNEITSMASKLFKDVKQSITEIISDYKNKHPAVVEDDVVNETAKPKQSETEIPDVKPTEEESQNHAKKDDIE